MTNYKLSNSVKEDLIRSHQFGVERFGVRQADKYFTELFESFERIASDPYSFISVDFIRQGYRKCQCGVDTIYLRINNDIVEIMSIVGRQDLENKLI